MTDKVDKTKTKETKTKDRDAKIVDEKETVEKEVETKDEVTTTEPVDEVAKDAPVEAGDNEFYDELLKELYDDTKAKDETMEVSKTEVTEERVREIAEDVAKAVLKSYAVAMKKGNYGLPTKSPETEEVINPDFESLSKSVETISKSLDERNKDIDKRLLLIADDMKKYAGEIEVIKNEPAEIVSKSMGKEMKTSGFKSAYKLKKDGSLEFKTI